MYKSTPGADCTGPQVGGRKLITHIHEDSSLFYVGGAGRAWSDPALIWWQYQQCAWPQLPADQVARANLFRPVIFLCD